MAAAAVPPVVPPQRLPKGLPEEPEVTLSLTEDQTRRLSALLEAAVGDSNFNAPQNRLRYLDRLIEILTANDRPSSARIALSLVLHRLTTDPNDPDRDPAKWGILAPGLTDPRDGPEDSE